MCGDKSARMIIKTGSGVPTIPVSADHRNGDWLVTDIYEGESYMDTDTGIVYTRNGSSILPVFAGGATETPKVWSAQITQAGTSNPVLTELINTLGVTVTVVRGAVGVYNLSGFNSNLTGLFKIETDFCYNNNVATVKSKTVVTTSTSTFSLGTYDGGTLTDGLLLGTLPFVNTITVTKYD